MVAPAPQASLPAGGAALAATEGLLLAGAEGDLIEADRAAKGRAGYLGLVGRWVRGGL